MRNNIFIKLLCSIPIILVSLYFIPFLGICLLLFRYYIYRGRNHYSMSITLIGCGLCILIPQMVNTVIGILNLDNVEIACLKEIIAHDIYGKLIEYSKLLITIGVIFTILTAIFSNISRNISSKMRNIVTNNMQRDYEIKRETALKIKEQQVKAKNTCVIICPYCGSDNIMQDVIERCKYCRRKLKNKNYS